MLFFLSQLFYLYKEFRVHPLLTGIIAVIAIVVTPVSSGQALLVAAPAKTEVEDHYQRIIYQAADLAKQPYAATEASVPQELEDIGYQQYRSIRFQTDKALWKSETKFEIQLFHPGFLYRHPVKINELIKDNISTIPFSSDWFRYDGEAVDFGQLVQSTLDFSGFRVHYPLNNNNYKDELVVFQGASYFRPLGPGYQYGASARGLAIDTAESSGEEFPYFKEFWLSKPGTNDNRMTIYALLDSPSITGAYRFILYPGIETHIKVRADLFARKPIKKIGIAPLTSMFFYGENKVRHHDDFRPEVHDSDGLLVQTQNNRWLWRPLSNPNQLRVSSFSEHSPKGFGLLQRDRDFLNYQDTEANYHARPSLWVEPVGAAWNQGRIELVEIPTADETNDNIVAYWVPEQSLQPNTQHTFEYALRITDSPGRQPLGKVVRTRIGWGSVPGQDNPPPKRKRQFMVDFAGWPANSFSTSSEVSAKLKTDTGVIDDLTTTLLPDGKTWRVMFKLLPDGNLPADMNLALTLNNQVISEVWSYVWYPDSLTP